MIWLGCTCRGIFVDDMSGILDNKTRVIDTVITTEGRRQLAEGGIDIQYVSFTDGTAFYSKSSEGGAEDATKRIYLEACQLPQDDITFRADDDGNLHPFRNGDGVPIAGGRILSYSFEALTASVIAGSGAQGVVPLNGDAFLEKAETLLAASIDNFKKMYLIASKDKVFEDDGFSMGPDKVTYTITNDRPLGSQDQHTAHVNSLDSVFSDPRFTHKRNFKYLPPVNKFTDKSLDRGDHRHMQKHFMGWYHPWGRTHMSGLSHRQIMAELNHFKMLGFCQTVSFDPTSRENKLVGQFFERSFNSLRKLDVIDYGVHQTGNANAPVAHIFFVGKVEVDEKGTDTFIHIFTLVFE